MKPKNQPLKVSLALSGGGARAILHIGFLEALATQGIQPVALSACSMGAVVAALIAAGHSPYRILALFTQQKVHRNIRPAWLAGGLLSLTPFFNKITPLLPHTFEELDIPITINATDLEQGKSLYFSSGPLLPILKASCSVPIVFPSVQYGKHKLYDGGILDNLPIAGLKQEEGVERWAIGSNAALPQKVSGLASLVERSLRLAINQNTFLSRHDCDLVIDPIEMGQFRMGDFKKAKEIFDLGRRVGERALQERLG